LRTLAFLVVSLVFIVLNQKSTEFQHLRSQLSIVTYPFQKAVDLPIRVLRWVHFYFQSKQELLVENASLRTEELLAGAKLQKLLVLEKENTQLRNMLQSASKISGKVTVAGLLAVDLDPSLNQVVLDKGKDDRVYAGQAVMDAYGILGQVIDVGPKTSRVLLITDSRFAIPVQDTRNNVRAIATGLGFGNQLTLLNVSNAQAVKVGDQFVASSLELRFPQGYPVGIVSEIKEDPSQQSALINLTPAARLDQAQQVLLAWPDNPQRYLQVQQQLKKKLPYAGSDE
jgi:rod shape-determining protein MreC